MPPADEERSVPSSGVAAALADAGGSRKAMLPNDAEQLQCDCEPLW